MMVKIFENVIVRIYYKDLVAHTQEKHKKKLYDAIDKIRLELGEEWHKGDMHDNRIDRAYDVRFIRDGYENKL